MHRTLRRLALLVVFGGQLTITYAQLSWPAVTATTKPWTRWWWMGSAVDQKDLTFNLEKYKSAGLGGMELTPIYGVKGYEDRFVDYLSPEWMKLFSFTLREAGRLGLGLDMSTGTGWPFGGGPLIDSTYACQEAFFKTWTVPGGGSLTDTVQFIQETLIHTDGFPKPTIDQLVQPIFANKNRQALALDQVRFPVRLSLVTLMAYSPSGQVLDLTDKVDARGRLLWTAPAGGSWTLYAIFRGAHGKMVERAAPGAEGNVIDHFSATALRKYLSRFDTAFRGHDLSGLRCFFNDSYEVDDARGQSNWTRDFFEIFRQHRGYDLRQHLPALFGKDTKENNDRILCDYRETISDLLLEQFTRPWGNWAHSKGALIRNQAHGSPANILDLYAASDIPETEGADVLRYKFGTSAAHVAGKKLASSESVTWLNEHFLSTLSDVKKAIDNYLLGGVNHIFYHGTAYTPQNDPWPGWLFYASVHFTPNDPSWVNFSALNEYITRCQSFLQLGTSDNDVLLYDPIYDSWSERGPALLKHYDRMEPEFNGTGFKECAEVMQRKGYGFDYISDKQVLGVSATPAMPKGASLVTSGGGRYQTILVPGNRRMPLPVLGKLLQLARSGARLLVYRSLPSTVPGWMNWQPEQDSLQQFLSRLNFTVTKDATIREATIGEGAVLVGSDPERLLSYAGIRRESMVDDSLDFVRRTYDGGNVYFIVNHSHKSWKGYLPLAASFRSAAIYEPMTGRGGLADQRDGRVYAELAPGGTLLIQARGAALKGPSYTWYEPAGPPVPIRGEWTINFVSGGPQLPAGVKTTTLGSWTLLGDAAAKFSGMAGYTITFPPPPGKAAAWLLDLGKVDGSAQVFLNGEKVATLIGPIWQVILPPSNQLKNILEVRVSGGMANRIEDMDRQGIVWKKFYNTNFPAHDRADRGANGLFDASKWAPLDAGLSGPVTLTPLKPRSLK